MSPTSPDARSRTFRRKLRLIQSTASLPTLFGVFGYMLLLTDLPAAEWATWWACLLVYGGIVGWIFETRHRPEMEPVWRYVDGREDDPGRVDMARAAFSTLAGLPIRMQRRELVVSLLPALIFPVAMELLGHSGWLEWARIRTYVAATLVGSLFASALVFYWVKRSFAGLCGEIAAAIGDPAGRAVLVDRLSLVQKLRFAVTLPALASVLLVVNVVYDSLRVAAEEAAVDWSQAALASVARADASLPIGSRVEARLPDRALWPNDLTILHVLPSEGGRLALAAASPELRATLDRELAGGDPQGGRLAPSGGRDVGAYRRMADGSLLLAVVDRDSLDLALGNMNQAVFWVCVVMVTCALLIGSLVCQDLRSALSRLRDEANRMASGDLRPGGVFESEDELGDLGRAFEAMGESLRNTIGRVSGAADRVERTAADVSVVVEALSSESREQFGRIRVANDLMLSINAQAQEVSQSARNLNETIEESGSSVLELGAAGD
ncbi:MAG TPA: methyl-accepting chemotaxis protein, partial [Myxococcota bacterium]|nr:methyl-accepting chemotaxis protein [Myxococcota bacterium]